MAMPEKDTTSLAFLYKDGIILASYSHPSSKASTVMEINSHTLCTMVGEPVDELFWIECERYRMQNNRRLPIELAADLLDSMMLHYFGNASRGEALIAGWEGKSPTLCMVDNRELGSLTGIRFSIGHGKWRVYKACDVGYNYNMSTSEAIAFAQQTLFEFGIRNGVASVYHVRSDGWDKILGYDVVKICPSPRQIEDKEKAAKDWQEYVKIEEQRTNMFDGFYMAGNVDSDMPMFESKRDRS